MKIKYGIDLGTTNSAIATIKNGNCEVIKSQNQDTIPSCVQFTTRKATITGAAALIAYGDSRNRSNTFIEFKRTMGTQKKYHSSNMERDFSSEELSAEVLKKLKEYTQDDKFKSVVITIPANFSINQEAATKKAGELAGFSQVYLLHEPMAAAYAYGINKNISNGQVLIFDFGGGTFDICLFNVEDGAMVVKDNDGDIALGGKDIDNAIVNEIILKYISENYKIENIKSDERKLSNLKDRIKIISEKLKIELSFSENYDVYEDGYFYLKEFKDDEGNPIDLELVVTADELEKVAGPIFKRAIDLTNEVLRRNNLTGDKLSSFLLVGGPTYSPILRKMIKDEICEPNTSVNPMTVVAEGAAVFASTKDIRSDILDEIKDDKKVQIECSYKSYVTDQTPSIPININEERTEFTIDSKLFINVKRAGWESGSKEVDNIGEIFELLLLKDKLNVFDIIMTDELGNIVQCEPNSISITHGVEPPPDAVLARDIGIEVASPSGKGVFKPIPGLEKNRSFPAKGETTVKTRKEIRAGSTDELVLNIFQGISHDSSGTRASNQLWVSNAVITGEDIPRLLPNGSDVIICLSIDAGGKYKLEFEIPYLNDIIEKELVIVNNDNESDEWFKNQFKTIDNEITDASKHLKGEGKQKLERIKFAITRAKKEFDNDKEDEGIRLQVKDELKKQFTALDTLEVEIELNMLEDVYNILKKEFNETENNSYKNDFGLIEERIEEVKTSEDFIQIFDLREECDSLLAKISLDKLGDKKCRAGLLWYHQNFETLAWRNKDEARAILNEAMADFEQMTEERALQYLERIWPLQIRRGEGEGPDWD